jgi:hypothetical protein
MKAATLPEIKKQLKNLDHTELTMLVLRLGRFKKENKELLTYLLFDADDEQNYIISIKEEIDEQMAEINTNHSYYAKKSLRKINRNLTKYIRYSGNKETEVELLIHFVAAIKKSGLLSYRNTTIQNMYDRLKSKIAKTLITLHEDLQADYSYLLERL